MKFRTKIILIVLLFGFEVFAQDNNNLTITVIGNNHEQRNLVVSINNGSNESMIIEKSLSPHSSIPNVVQLDNRNLAFIFGLEGMIEICDSGGNLLTTLFFFELPPYNEQVLKYCKTKNGLHLIISEQEQNRTYSINNIGIIESSIDVESGHVKGFTTSSSGSFLAYSIDNWINNNIESTSYIFNIKTNKSSGYQFYFDKGNFNEAGDLLLAQNKSQVFLIDVNINEIIWATNLEKKKIYLDANFYNDEVLLVNSDIPIFVGNKWFYKNGEITKKSILGKSINVQNIKKDFSEFELVKRENKLIFKTDKEIVEIK